MTSEFDRFDDLDDIEEYDDLSDKPLIDESWKRMIKLGLLALLAVALIVAAFFIGSGIGGRNARDKAVEAVKTRYMDELGFELFITCYLLDSVEDWNDSSYLDSLSDTLANPFFQLMTDLEAMKAVSAQTYRTLNSMGAADSKYYQNIAANISVINDFASSLDQLGGSIGSGATLNGIRVCYGFLEDSIISDKEAKFLTSLKGDLEEIKNSLFIENPEAEGETSVNPDITLEELAEILKPFTKKYAIINLTSIGLGN